jgi:hypothetical protein
MEKPEVCFIRLYHDNREDALIIAALGARKRKGEKSKIIKDILHSYFYGEKTECPESKSTPKLTLRRHSSPSTCKEIANSSAFLPAVASVISDEMKEVLKRNMDELSDMFT